MGYYERVKHIATDLTVCSMATGYDYEFLCQCVYEDIEEGFTIDRAMQDVLQTAYEMDY